MHLWKYTSYANYVYIIAFCITFFMQLQDICKKIFLSILQNVYLYKKKYKKICNIPNISL